MRDLVVGTEYEPIRELGAGGMGRAWLARHMGLNRLCVLKVIHEGFAFDEQFRARAAREARALALIDHPGVVRVFDFRDAPDGRQLLAMEYVEGETLASVLRHGRLSIGRSLRLIVSLLEGLQAVHDAGLLHRDLKPGNIIIRARSGDERAVIIDFGLTKGLGPQEDPPLTEQGLFMGTPQYVSPEQACNLPLTPQADLYSVGIVLFECLAGRPPFDVRDQALLFRCHLQVHPPPLVRGEAPPSLHRLQTLVWQALAKDPDRRLASASAFANALREVLADLLDPDAVLEVPAPKSATTLSQRLLPASLLGVDPRREDAVGENVGRDDSHSDPSVPIALDDPPRSHRRLGAGIVALLLVLVAASSAVVLGRGPRLARATAGFAQVVRSARGEWERAVAGALAPIAPKVSPTSSAAQASATTMAARPHPPRTRPTPTAPSTTARTPETSERSWTGEILPPFLE